MDNLQAAILNFRLSKLKNIIDIRRKNANTYINGIKNKNIFLPIEKDFEFNTYHTFVIQTEKRDNLKKYLDNNGIDTAIHYPVPIHLQPASKDFGYQRGDFPVAEKQSSEILTLPINQSLSSDDIELIIDKINKWDNN